MCYLFNKILNYPWHGKHFPLVHIDLQKFSIKSYDSLEKIIPCHVMSNSKGWVQGSLHPFQSKVVTILRTQQITWPFVVLNEYPSWGDWGTITFGRTSFKSLKKILDFLLFTKINPKNQTSNIKSINDSRLIQINPQPNV